MAQGTTADQFPPTATKSQADQGAAEWFFARLPAAVRDGLTGDQVHAIADTLEKRGPNKPPVSIRFSLPFLFRRVFFAVIAGTEKRSHERLAQDRQRNPLLTLGNSIFLFGCGVMFFLALFIVILFSSSIIEY